MKARKVKGLAENGDFAANARRIIEVRLGELCALAPKALDESRPKKLHDMRIAAKRLRYVLEIARPALGAGASDGARAAKKLQEILGDIHDCDEMLPRVEEHARRLRAADVDALTARAGARARDLDPTLASTAPNLDRYRGLEALAAHVRARRRVLFARFQREWARLEERDFPATLLESINEPVPAPQAPQAGAAA
ncbi:MAG: CHAD domain-containing protein [Thermoleophilaceae bacterium]